MILPKIKILFILLSITSRFLFAQTNALDQILSVSPALCITNSTLNLSSTFSGLNLKNKIETASKSVGLQKKNQKFKYAVFDICKSFWKKSLYDLLYAYQKQKGVSLSYYLKMVKFGVSYALGNLDPKEAYESFLKYCKGSSIQDLKKNCSQIWQRECKNFIFKDAIEIFEEHKKDGSIMILTESGFSELYDDLCSEYKFDYRCVSELEFKDGKITGKLVGQPCSGKEKLAKVQKLIEGKLGGSLKDAIFYANSHNDIPLLEKVGKPVAVNPDSKLEACAQKRGWQILRFK